jgi:hypothetical protein
MCGVILTSLRVDPRQFDESKIDAYFIGCNVPIRCESTGSVAMIFCQSAAAPSPYMEAEPT